ncbi:MAG: hypothetical protein IJJ50_09165 [Lachnospiraceae bacterium]|nr:hypothetical protein [Lachnospiraceae bacterium]
MKRRFTVFVCILAVCAALAGCGSSSSSGKKSESSPAIEIKDILTKHEAYHTASGDGWDEYTTVFFGNDTKTLKALFIETRFDKSAGYTKEDLEALDIDTVYEGFSGFAFADYKIEESEEALNYVVRFRKLDDVENCKKLHEAGLLTLEQTTGISAVDAQTIMDDLEKNGYEKVQMIDYGKLNLHFDLD